MAGRSFFSLDRTKVRTLVRKCVVYDCMHARRGVSATRGEDLPVAFGQASWNSHALRDRDAIQQASEIVVHACCGRHIAIRCIDQSSAADAQNHTLCVSHRPKRQHGQRKNQSLHLQSPVLRNSRHNRVHLRGCQHPRPAGTGAFRAGLGHTARGRGRPHLSAPFTSLLDCARRHADVARSFGVAA